MKSVRGCLPLVLLLFAVSCSPPRGVYHTVGRGQTLYQISKTYRIDESYLARVNGISDPTRLKVGQKIFIPGATRTRYVPATVPSSVVKKTARSTADTTRVIPKAKVTRKTEKPKKSTTVRVPPQRSLPSGPGGTVSKAFFAWPQRGKIVKTFGTRNGKVSHGIEIAMPAGSSVSSAAAGRVIYSGDGISGYGNLIVIQHEKDYYSVYGYNKKNLVKTGSFVSKGQKIALSGTPPSGGIPRLYFEIRHGKKPVNPLTLLP
ncbi:MAG: M23 family metallopeptidase [Deltaproteobacteria bacterium]|nr:MAG: M23 family metallopeptidase [Deltaproteobacteria bacterium]